MVNNKKKNKPPPSPNLKKKSVTKTCKLFSGSLSGLKGYKTDYPVLTVVQKCIH